MTAEQAPEPAGKAPSLASWDAAVDSVLTWVENIQCDHQGGGFIPSELLRHDEQWRREQFAGGRLEDLVALVSKAETANADSEPAKQLLKLLRGRKMPSATTLTAAADRVRTTLGLRNTSKQLAQSRQSVSTSDGPKQKGDIHEILRKLLATLGPMEDRGDPFIQVMTSGGIFAIGVIDEELDSLDVVDMAVEYADRWVSEGGPHPDERPPHYDPYRKVDLMMRDAPPDRPELPEWGDPWTQRVRGRLATVLTEFLGQHDGSDSEPDLPGHWVPARLLVDTTDSRIDGTAKISPFCEQHGIPKRPGTTKEGKPWPQRCDVHLESWEEKLAALRKEEQRLQDAADAKTADKSTFEQWKRQDSE